MLGILWLVCCRILHKSINTHADRIPGNHFYSLLFMSNTHKHRRRLRRQWISQQSIHMDDFSRRHTTKIRCSIQSTILSVSSIWFFPIHTIELFLFHVWVCVFSLCQFKITMKKIIAILKRCVRVGLAVYPTSDMWTYIFFQAEFQSASINR